MPEDQQLCVAEAADDLKKDIALESDRLMGAMRSLTELPGWWDDMSLVAALNRVMEVHQAYVLGMRVLLSEALCCWARLRRSNGLRGMGFRSGPDTSGLRVANRWSMAGPQGPPGWEEAEAEREPRSLIFRCAPLLHLLMLATEDARAFCIEKNGIAPEVVVSGDEGLMVCCIDTYVEHIYLECLKNSMQALVNKWGAWNVDEADPIQVTVKAIDHTVQSPMQPPSTATHTSSSSSSSRPTHLPTAGPVLASDSSPATNGTFIEASASSTVAGGMMQLTIVDKGGGMLPSTLQRSMDWFSTTNTARRNTGYGYSRDHGAIMQGMGVGMPLSVVYARFMGGSISWESDKASGTTTVQLLLPQCGFSF